MFLVLTGLAAGCLHVVTGPDHLAALAPIAANDPARAGRLGALWGLGHGVGVVVLGALGIWAREWIDIDLLSAWSEFIVGFLLIGLGAWAFLMAGRVTLHSHSHVHDQLDEHAHFHVHMSGDHRVGAAHGLHSHAALGVGLLHGAAGAGHLFGVLPSLALPANQALIYLLAYCVAAIGSMGAVGLALCKALEGQSMRTIRRTMRTCGLVALAVGGVWLSHGMPTS